MAESPSRGTASSPATKAVGGDKDRVVMASRHPDGSPAQTADFAYIGDQDASVAAAKAQLSEQAVSAADVRERGITGGATDQGNDQDPDVAKLAKTHESAAKSAESAAEREVKDRFEDVGA